MPSVAVDRLVHTLRPCVLIGVALILSACMNGSNGEIPSQSERDNAPACDDIWVLGETLPADYRGCHDGDVYRGAVPGPNGDCQVVVHEVGGKGLYAELGETIVESPDMTSDEAFDRAIEPCVEYGDPS